MDKRFFDVKSTQDFGYSTVFNSEKYLAETIDSLMKQQMKDMEFIFVNDGSTDKSSEILKSKIENDKRFIVIDQENQGQSIARNTGLNAARGEYIFFLDSDDLLSDNYFEELYETAKSKRFGFSLY